MFHKNSSSRIILNDFGWKGLSLHTKPSLDQQLPTAMRLAHLQTEKNVMQLQISYRANFAIGLFLG